jgi:hypothetical protein
VTDKQSPPSAVEAAILALAEEAGPSRSFDPSDVARRLAPEPGDAWRRHLTAIRRAAARLAAAGHIDILRKGKPVPPEDLRGVIRLRQRITSE